MAASWFQYNGPGTITDPLAYSIITTPSCSGSNKICAINAEIQMLGTPPVERPVIDSSFALVIQNAEATHTPTGTVRLKA